MDLSDAFANMITEAIEDLNESSSDSATNLSAPNNTQHFSSIVGSIEDYINSSNNMDAEQSTDNDRFCPIVGDKISFSCPGKRLFSRY